MVKRLPMSLKFDEESEFYKDFIKEKQNNLELTSFIVEILESYYHSEEVREKVDEYIKEQNPHLKIYEEITRMALEHKKHENSIHVLKDYNTNAKKEYNKNKNKKKKAKENQYKEKPKQLSQLEELQELERLTEKFGLTIEGNKIKKPNVSNEIEESIEEMPNDNEEVEEIKEEIDFEETKEEKEKKEKNEEIEERKSDSEEKDNEESDKEKSSKISFDSSMGTLMGSLNKH